jgi:hypothetical protein
MDPQHCFPEMWQFYKLDVRGKLVAVSHQLMTPQQKQESKQQQGLIPAATRTPALSKGNQQVTAQPQQQKGQQQQDLWGKSFKSGRK